MKRAEMYNSKEIDEIFESISQEEAKKVENRMLLAVKIEKAMKSKGHNKINFARIMNKRPSEISKWLSGTHNFTIDTLFDIEEKLNINLINLGKDKQPNSNYFYLQVSSNTTVSLTENKSNNDCLGEIQVSNVQFTC